MDNSFLGTGWSFPPSFDSQTGKVSLVNHEQDIQQSLLILLSTSPGERVMHPSFGCNIKKMVFENINEGVIAKIKDAVEKAILYFEPRITLNKVWVDTETDPAEANSVYNGVLEIHLDYTIRKTNTRSNWVYPFYFAEVQQV